MAPDIQLLWLIDPESDDEVADPRSVSTARPVTGSDARHRAGSLARQRPKNRERRRRGDHALARAPRSGRDCWALPQQRNRGIALVSVERVRRAKRSPPC